MQVENLYSRGSERLLEFKPVNEVILKVHFGLVKFKNATSNWMLDHFVFIIVHFLHAICIYDSVFL